MTGAIRFRGELAGRPVAALALLALAACGGGSPILPGGLDCPGTQADPVCPATEGSVAGRVVDANTGAPIVGAIVATSPSTGTALSDGVGQFQIAGIDLSGGERALSVTAVRSGYASDSEVVILRPEDARATVELALSPSGPAGVAPDVDLNLNVLVRHRDAGFGGATVEMRDVSGTVLRTAVSDANGFAVFPEVDFGTYTVRATATIAGRPFAASSGVQIQPGQVAFVQLDLRQVF